GARDDRCPRPEFPDEFRDDLRRVRAVAVQEHDKLVPDPRDEFPERGSFAVPGLDENLGPKPLGDRAGLVRGPSVEQVDAVGDPFLLERLPRNPVEDRRNTVFLVQGRQQDRKARQGGVRDLSPRNVWDRINGQGRVRERVHGRPGGSPQAYRAPPCPLFRRLTHPTLPLQTVPASLRPSRCALTPGPHDTSRWHPWRRMYARAD